MVTTASGGIENIEKMEESSTGIINSLARDSGTGVIRGSDGKLYPFHFSTCKNVDGDTGNEVFDTLHIGDEVTFHALEATNRNPMRVAKDVAPVTPAEASVLVEQGKTTVAGMMNEGTL